MKFILKFITICFLVLTEISFSFAKTYSEYLQDAKKYESEKKWVHALNSYYDALGSNEPLDNKEEAFNSYILLKNTLTEDKKPGFGEFDEFEWHDEWQKLIKETYATFFDDFKLGINTNSWELKKINQNYELRTADYELPIVFFSASNLHAFHIIEKTVKTNKEFYDKLKFTNHIKYVKGEKEARNIKYKLDDGSYTCCIHDYSWNYEITYASFVSGFSNVSGYYVPSVLDGKFISFEINIVDENGNELVESQSFIGDSPSECVSTYIFKSVPANIIKMLDSGKAFFNIKAAYKRYGYNLSEQEKIPENRFVIDSEFLYTSNANNYKDYTETKKRFMETVSYFVVKNIKFTESEDGYKQSEIILSKDFPVILESEYAEERGEAISNKLSMFYGMTPVFFMYNKESHNKEIDYKKWNWNYKIEENEEANGFRYKRVEDKSVEGIYLYTIDAEKKKKYQEEKEFTEHNAYLDDCIKNAETVTIENIYYDKKTKSFQIKNGKYQIKRIFIENSDKYLTELKKRNLYSNSYQLYYKKNNEIYYGKRYKIFYENKDDSYFDEYRNFKYFIRALENDFVRDDSYDRYNENGLPKLKFSSATYYIVSENGLVYFGKRYADEHKISADWVYRKANIEKFMQRYKDTFGEDYISKHYCPKNYPKICKQPQETLRTHTSETFFGFCFFFFENQRDKCFV